MSDSAASAFVHLFADTPYRPVRRLGAGGMGEVWLVEQTELGRRFAAKLLHSRYASDPQLRDRLRIEVQTIARLNELRHPNIAQVVDSRTMTDGRPFIVMEFLQGRSVNQELSARGGWLPVGEAIGYVLQLLSALSAAHAIGVVHRDIKPHNLFLRDEPDGSERTLLVLDFGVARILPGAQGAPRPLAIPTDTGIVVGSPHYMSPEGARGLRVGARGDLYGAGLVLYEMVAGRGPFDHAPDPLMAHANEEPKAPSIYAPQPVPAELDRAVLRALAKDPDGRFATADEFSAELAAVLRLLRRHSGGLETTTFRRMDLDHAAIPIATVTRDDSSADASLAPLSRRESPSTEAYDRAHHGSFDTQTQPDRQSIRRIGNALFVSIVLLAAAVGALLTLGLLRLVGGR